MPPLGSEAARTIVRRLPPYRVYRRANWLLTRVPGAGLLRTGPMTAQWAVKALVRSRRGQPDGLPTAVPTVALGAQVAIDEALLGLMMRPSKFPSMADYSRVGDEVAAAAELYRQRGWVTDPAAYHRTPPPLDGVSAARGWWLRERYEHLQWESGFEPRGEEPAADRWQTYEPVRTAHAHLLRHRGADRPWVICLHGFGMGYVQADFAAFVVRKVHHELGLNLAFPVMPLHGRRREPTAPDLLSYDLMNTVHGITQAVWDIRRLAGWLRDRTSQPIGVHGISLGGYTGALLTALHPLDAIIAGVPAVDFPALFRHHAPGRVERAATNRGVLGQNATDAHRVISPLALPCQVPPEHRFIYAGLGDRLVPPPQPRLLWRHWGEPTTSWYPGNHMGFMWSSKVKRFVIDSLDRAGFLDHVPPGQRAAA